MTGPIGEPPLDALPPDAPATVEDVRVGRRWTWVALVWAVAASAIAVIALLQANNNDNNAQTSTTTTSSQVTPQQFDDLQKQTNARLDAFSHRLNDQAAQADLAKLDKRVTQTEDDLSQAKDDNSKNADAITQLQSDLKDLQQRVQDLEDQQNSNNNGSGTGTTP